MKKYWLLNLSAAILLLSMVNDQRLNSSVYNLEKLVVKKTSGGETRNFLKGPTLSLAMFEINAIVLNPGKITDEYIVNNGTDELIIIKKGTLEIKVNNEIRNLSEGSVFVAMAGNSVTISNNQNEDAAYFSMRFKPNAEQNQNLTREKVQPFFVNWDTVEFKISANGGRRNIMQQPTSLMKELEIHVTTIKEGMASHSGHTHPDEEIILMRYGTAEMIVNEKHFTGSAGSIFFLTNEDFHGLSNNGKGSCEYYAIRWLTD